MSSSATTAASFLPSLRDALAPEDPPVRLDYWHLESPSLTLTDVHGAALGDPIREYVNDVLGRIDDHAGALDVVRAAGRVAPERTSGSRLDLLELAGLLSDARLACAIFDALARHTLTVQIPLSVTRRRTGQVQIDGAPKVGFITPTDDPLPPEINRALSGYAKALATVTAQMGRSSLGPWLADSGLTQLTFAGRFTVPVVNRGRAPTGLSDPRPPALQ